MNPKNMEPLELILVNPEVKFPGARYRSYGLKEIHTSLRCLSYRSSSD